MAERLSVLEPRRPWPGLPEAEPDATLHRVSAEVGRGDAAIAISLGIVVMLRQAQDRVVAVAYSPVVPNTQVVQRDGDVVRLLERAAVKFAKQMSKWSPAAILLRMSLTTLGSRPVDSPSGAHRS